MSEEKKALNDDELENVNGGAFLYNQNNSYKYEQLDLTQSLTESAAFEASKISQ